LSKREKTQTDKEGKKTETTKSQKRGWGGSKTGTDKAANGNRPKPSRKKDGKMTIRKVGNRRWRGEVPRLKEGMKQKKNGNRNEKNCNNLMQHTIEQGTASNPQFKKPGYEKEGVENLSFSAKRRGRWVKEWTIGGWVRGGPANGKKHSQG